MTRSELTVWRLFLDTTAELRRLLGSELEEVNLSPGDYQVLLALVEAPRRSLRSAELAAAIDWQRSRLSHHLARMEHRGLIERRDCATDGRGADVMLSAEGSRAFQRATAPHLRSIKRHFADALSPDQFRLLADILDTLRTHMASGRDS
jgi:DNA-binding MarR family transcriptional regulator